MNHPLRWLLIAILLAFFCPQAWGASLDLVSIKGPINPISANYIRRGLQTAERDGVPLILMIDTPGGLDGSMRDIVQGILSARIPVVAYVAPSGARAASAGLFIAMAAPVLAMAPNTAMGAAHPVGGQGEEIKGPLGEKITNDAIAYISDLATRNGRNAEWSVKAVRRSVSVPASKAVQLKVADFIATDLEDLKTKLDGRKVKVGNQSVTLKTKNASVHNLAMDGMETILYRISDPTIAFILLSLGVTAITVELWHPGAILPGVTGAICLLLAFFSLGMLPINYVGVILILLAFAMFIAEVFVTSFGLLTVGGIIAMILGGMMLVNSSALDRAISLQLVVTVALSLGAFLFLAMWVALKAQRIKVTTGSEAMVGIAAEARSDLSPKGEVFINGELWRAISESGNIPKGATVVVTAVEGLTLHVIRKETGVV